MRLYFSYDQLNLYGEYLFNIINIILKTLYFSNFGSVLLKDIKQIFHAFLFNIKNYSPEVINI